MSGIADWGNPSLGQEPKSGALFVRTRDRRPPPPPPPPAAGAAVVVLSPAWIPKEHIDTEQSNDHSRFGRG